MEYHLGAGQKIRNAKILRLFPSLFFRVGQPYIEKSSREGEGGKRVGLNLWVEREKKRGIEKSGSPFKPDLVLKVVKLNFSIRKKFFRKPRKVFRKLKKNTSNKLKDH